MQHDHYWPKKVSMVDRVVRQKPRHGSLSISRRSADRRNFSLILVQRSFIPSKRTRWRRNMSSRWMWNNVWLRRLADAAPPTNYLPRDRHNHLTSQITKTRLLFVLDCTDRLWDITIYYISRRTSKFFLDSGATATLWSRYTSPRHSFGPQL